MLLDFIFPSQRHLGHATVYSNITKNEKASIALDGLKIGKNIKYQINQYMQETSSYDCLCILYRNLSKTHCAPDRSTVPKFCRILNEIVEKY